MQLISADLRYINSRTPFLESWQLPDGSCDELFMTINKFYRDFHGTVLFCFVRYDDMIGKYYELLFYDSDTMIYNLFSNNYVNIKRFVLRPGYRLPLNQEDELFETLNAHNFVVDTLSFNKFEDDLMREHSYHMKEYTHDCYCIYHLYFVLQTNGIYHELFKSGLCNIAFQLSDLIDILYEQVDVEKIFNGMPIRLLKLLNRESTLIWKYMISECDRCVAKEIYSRFSELLDNMRCNASVFEYLEYVVFNNAIYDEEVIQYLSSTNVICSVKEYVEYLTLGNRLKEHFAFIKMPDSDDEYTYQRRQLMIVDELVKNEKYINSNLQIRASHIKEYWYEDDSLLIRPALNVKEVCNVLTTQDIDGFSLGTGLMDITGFTSNEGSILILCRCKESDGIPYLTMVIDNIHTKRIVYLKRTDNREIAPVEMEKLMDKYILPLKLIPTFACVVNNRPFFDDAGLPFA